MGSQVPCYPNTHGQRVRELKLRSRNLEHVYLDMRVCISGEPVKAGREVGGKPSPRARVREHKWILAP